MGLLGATRAVPAPNCWHMWGATVPQVPPATSLSPDPLGAPHCHRRKKKILFIDYMRSVSRLKPRATNIPQRETPSNLSLPSAFQLMESRRFSSPCPFLVLVTNSGGQSLSCPGPCRGCAQRALQEEAESVPAPDLGSCPIEAGTEPGFLPAASHGSSWRQGWGTRQMFHLHFNFNKIVLFCVLLPCWCNKSIH